MSSTVTIFPPASSTIPPGALNRPAEPSRLRPVEPIARVQPQQQRSSLGTFSAHRDQSAGTTSGRHRPLPVPTFRPARPSSDGFFAQIMSQAADGQHEQKLPLSADASARGNEAYRKAGAEPAVLSQEPEIFRIVA